jgi:hypothetical protein
MVLGSEDPGPDIQDPVSAFNTNDKAQYLGEYRRIVARHIDSSGRRMARVEWKNTWEPEDKLGGLKNALHQYTRERRESASMLH